MESRSSGETVEPKVLVDGSWHTGQGQKERLTNENPGATMQQFPNHSTGK